MGTMDSIVSMEVMLSNKLGNIKLWKSTILIPRASWARNNKGNMKADLEHLKKCK
jgi:hypothetical protein